MEVVEDVHWIEGVTGNCFIVADNELTLIDTGLPGSAKKIVKFIEDDLHRDLSGLKTIVLTHSHYDHMGGASELKTRTGARVAAHQEDAGFIEGAKRPAPPKGGVRILFALLSPLVKPKRVKVDRLLKDGDMVGGMKVVHVPGHTLGSIALLDPVRGVLFSGDALTFRNGKVTPPPLRFTVDSELARQSIAKIGSLEFDTMLGGHGDPLMPNAASKVREFDRTGYQQ